MSAGKRGDARGRRCEEGSGSQPTVNCFAHIWKLCDDKVASSWGDVLQI